MQLTDGVVLDSNVARDGTSLGVDRAPRIPILKDADVEQLTICCAAGVVCVPAGGVRVIRGHGICADGSHRVDVILSEIRMVVCDVVRHLASHRLGTTLDDIVREIDSAVVVRRNRAGPRGRGVVARSGRQRQSIIA